MTKAQGKTLFYKHMYHIMGSLIPEYSKHMLGTQDGCKNEQLHAQIMRLGGGCHTII